MQDSVPKFQAIQLGVVVRRLPGATRWRKYAWKAIGVMPGAPDAQWRELRREGDAVEYHAATRPLEVYHTDTEAYLAGLGARDPSIYLVMRESFGEHPLEVLLVTASPYEAQDFADNGEDIVEKVPMPDGVVAWLRDFIEAHHSDEAFVKRRRNKSRVDQVEDGIGDPRITQLTDVYRAPMTVRRAAE
ncbi:DUF3305 domain-containing protein [Falsihalocynthiibacter sp. SS001]|uniref:DUF3305 domain-containing protein n=1 Tax=Falsihalocynthiibacter sp. SS001 TaxID=3349698 RepID=UPI0036D2F59E